MFKFKVLWALGVVIALAPRAVGAELSLTDFAYGVSVTVPAGPTIVELPLPDLVYRTAVFSDLRDLRVFDAQGTQVIHSLTLPETGANRWEYTPSFFPVKGVGPAERAAIAVTATNHGAGIEVFLSGAKSVADAQTVAYLVDMRELRKMQAQPAVTAVVLGWNGLADGMPLRVSLEASDDLQKWHTLNPGGVVGRFTHAGEHLVVNRIEFPNSHSNYLKLCWAPLFPFEVTAVTLQLVDRTAPTLAREWERTDAMVGGEPGAYYAALKGAFPVDRLKIGLQDNRVIEVSVFSRSDPQSPWVRRGGGKVFRLLHGGDVVTSDALRLQRSTDREWKIVVEGKDAVAGLPSLRAEFGWLPHRLQFLPQGTGPYTVAYGNGAAKVADFGLHSLKNTVDSALGEQVPSIGRAQILSTQVLGGPSKLEKGLTNKRSIVLWGVLLGGVAIFGVMAVRLYREMNTQTPG